MAIQLTAEERRRFYVVLTGIASVLVLFWLGAIAAGQARWQDLLLPLALLSLFVRAIIRSRRPNFARGLLWMASVLLVAGAIYAASRLAGWHLP